MTRLAEGEQVDVIVVIQGHYFVGQNLVIRYCQAFIDQLCYGTPVKFTHEERLNTSFTLNNDLVLNIFISVAIHDGWKGYTENGEKIELM
ncbi:hypothetical protein E3N88_35472 [Mikania micrantha]|uniref:Uncharacterized protein n=1 Tax=Mikania micrantha TaxID=192012 RepID=A0A5N6M1F5_9ASTR|nr:hypothetical protein E3N88_35472 [Mikania micrantha]